LCEAAFSLVRCDTEYKRFYALKYNNEFCLNPQNSKEVNKFQHKRALAETGRKMSAGLSSAEGQPNL
jgi:hypothetical protein